jgi:hypothetical protein
LLLHAIFRAKGTRCCLQKRRLLRENIRAAKRIIGNTLALQTAMWLEKLTRDFGFSIRQNQAIVRASLRGPVRRRPLVAQHTGHVFRSPGNDGLAERMDRTSRAAQLEMTASAITLSATIGAMPQRVSDLRNWKGSTSRIKVYFVGYPSAVLVLTS